MPRCNPEQNELWTMAARSVGCGACRGLCQSSGRASVIISRLVAMSGAKSIATGGAGGILSNSLPRETPAGAVPELIRGLRRCPRPTRRPPGECREGFEGFECHGGFETGGLAEISRGLSIAIPPRCLAYESPAEACASRQRPPDQHFNCGRAELPLCPCYFGCTRVGEERITTNIVMHPTRRGATFLTCPSIQDLVMMLLKPIAL